MPSFRSLILAASLATIAVLVTGCTAPDPPTPDPTPPVTTNATPTATHAPTPAPVTPDSTETPADGDIVTFTYVCWAPTADGKGTKFPFATWEEAWTNPEITSCEPTRHGSVITPEMENAVDIAEVAYGGDRDFVLASLHAQCAMTANPYLLIDQLTGLQVDEVKGILALCPDRPGADKLRSALPAGS